jgi:hypothetical protein
MYSIVWNNIHFCEKNNSAKIEYILTPRDFVAAADMQSRGR